MLVLSVDVLCDAIKNRRVLEIVYPPGVRLIEPHALGYSSERHILLRAYQIFGASGSGEHEWWKLFRIDRLQDAIDSGACFIGPRPLYRRGDTAMKGGIIVEL
jgi:hypothetical protein